MAARGGPASVEVTGARELRKALKRMDDGLDDMKAVNAAAGAVVAGAARGLVPVVSGALLDTIRSDRRAGGAAVLAGSRRVVYAGPIHFGWPRRNIEAQGFLYDAADDRREEVAGLYAGEVARLVRRVDREAP